MDLSLDDIIKSSGGVRGGRRGRGGRGGARGGARGRGRGGNRGSGGAVRRQRTNVVRQTQTPYSFQKFSSGRGEREYVQEEEEEGGVWQHDMYNDEEEEGEEEWEEEVTVGNGNNFGKAKIHVANLEYSVSEDNLREVFSKVGMVKTVVIHYDKSGRSKGTANVTFARKSDAMSAISKFNGVEIEGRAIRLTVDSQQSGGIVFSGGNPRRFKLSSTARPRGTRGISRGRARGGGGAGRGRGRGRRSSGVKVTEEELDADLDDYNMNE